MSCFSGNSDDSTEKIDAAFNLVGALKEGFTIANRNQTVSYKEVFEKIKEISLELYNDISRLLTQTNESTIIKYYKQKATAISKNIIGKPPVLPEALIEHDLIEERKLLKANEKNNLIKKKILELEMALEHFKPQSYSEDYILAHDFNIVPRHKFFDKEIYNSAKVKDYQLSNNRVLRLKLLHPDKAEKIIGSDLVYEQFDLEKELVRFVHLQYKIWDTKALYFSVGNLKKQIEKLDKNICQSGYCSNINNLECSTDYRFPYCSAFLRPTSYSAKPESSIVSTGIHLPICAVNKIKAKDNSINNKNIIGKSISQKLFGELFIDNQIGSRWISISELDKFYTEKGITSEIGIIRVHLQEIIIKS